ncbi:MAG: L-fucose/L-arabinose isomerase family protein, partial [Anaerolineales bacterium]|nr:L-fucose/L-arabinose isomerase family protein [Anaerolineales bacterium]
REEILQVLEQEQIEVVILGTPDTHFGSVESLQDAFRCADLFKANREKIDGILVTLPNFGDERSVAETIRMADLEVPVLVQAFPDDANKMAASDRRDSFCGKMSVCNNLWQFGIPYSLTSSHTVKPDSDSFRQDLKRFGEICRVVRGLKGARFGMLGVRPANFITVRYSEKILERAGISVEVLDLSEALGRADRLKSDDPAVQEKLSGIKCYLSTQVPSEPLLKMSKFALVMERWMEENQLVATAVQCWTAMEEFFGVVPCTVMSMMSNMLKPSACESDITGAIGMYAMALASGTPSALVDWNNNYGDDPEKGVIFHCSNLPVDLIQAPEMSYQDIIANTVGKENTYGTVVGRIKTGLFTYCRVSTDDCRGVIRAYLGEGRLTGDQLETFGGYGVIEIPHFQSLLRYICANGFEHHVAINRAQVADALEEALVKYLGWEVYHHKA